MRQIVLHPRLVRAAYIGLLYPAVQLVANLLSELLGAPVAWGAFLGGAAIFWVVCTALLFACPELMSSRRMQARASRELSQFLGAWKHAAVLASAWGARALSELLRASKR